MGQARWGEFNERWSKWTSCKHSSLMIQRPQKRCKEPKHCPHRFSWRNCHMVIAKASASMALYRGDTFARRMLLLILCQQLWCSLGSNHSPWGLRHDFDGSTRSIPQSLTINWFSWYWRENFVSLCVRSTQRYTTVLLQRKRMRCPYHKSNFTRQCTVFSNQHCYCTESYKAN